MSTTDSSYSSPDQSIADIGLIDQLSVTEPVRIPLPKAMVVQMNNNSYSREDRDGNRTNNFQRDLPLSQSVIPYSRHQVANNKESGSRYSSQFPTVQTDATIQQENKSPKGDNICSSPSLSMENLSQGDLDGDQKSDGSRSRKKSLAGSDDGNQDHAYWEKRRKNNESAKRSRDARRMKEEQIAMRVVYLEQENLQLRTEAQLLKSEIDKLRSMVYSMQ